MSQNESGYIYILYNEMYKYYGDNVFKVGKSKDVIQRMSGYTTSYIKAVEIKFISGSCLDYSIAETNDIFKT